MTPRHGYQRSDARKATETNEWGSPLPLPAEVNVTLPPYLAGDKPLMNYRGYTADYPTYSDKDSSWRIVCDGPCTFPPEEYGPLPLAAEAHVIRPAYTTADAFLSTVYCGRCFSWFAPSTIHACPEDKS